MRLLLILVFLFATPALASDGEEDAAILAVIEQYLDAQKDRNTEVWLDVMLPDGMIMSHREREGQAWVLNTRTVAGDLMRLTSGDVVVDERIYNPTILHHKTIATVWAPYDIYVDDRLLHCGIDVWQLFKVEGSWKISHFSYTTEPNGCEDLGIGPRE